MKKLHIINHCFLLFFLFESCMSQSENQSTSINLVNLLKEYNTNLSLQHNHSIIIIPIDLTCQSCRDKCIDLIQKGKFTDTNIQIVLSSSNEKDMQIFLLNKAIKVNDYTNIILDTKNLAFANNLVFVSPMIYYLNKSTLVKKVELAPINIDNELDNLLNTQ